MKAELWWKRTAFAPEKAREFSSVSACVSWYTGWRSKMPQPTPGNCSDDRFYIHVVDREIGADFDMPMPEALLSVKRALLEYVETMGRYAKSSSEGSRSGHWGSRDHSPPKALGRRRY
jgi:hypothetical protein